MTSEYIEERNGGYYVAGTRISLDSVVYSFERGNSPEAIQKEYTLLTLPQIYGAIAFYLDHQADIRSFQVEPSFDVALMMFAVLGYQLENQDVLAALGTARKHLRSGGLFVFDVWYGPAVLSQGPTERTKVIPTERGQILRVATGELDIGRHLCKVSYRLWKIEDGRSGDQTEETHVVRYFFPVELKLFLESAGFASLRLGVFPDFDRDPDTSTWNVLGVARAV